MPKVKSHGAGYSEFRGTCGNSPLYTGPTCAQGEESPLIQILAYILAKRLSGPNKRMQGAGPDEGSRAEGRRI